MQSIRLTLAAAVACLLMVALDACGGSTASVVTVSAPSDVATVLATLTPGSTVTIGITRPDGSSTTVKVTLGQYPGSAT